jgi:hypothetical protein
MRFSGELFSPARSRRISGAASDLGAVRALATGGSVESRDLPACHGDDQMKRIFFCCRHFGVRGGPEFALQGGFQVADYILVYTMVRTT